MVMASWGATSMAGNNRPLYIVRRSVVFVLKFYADRANWLITV